MDKRTPLYRMTDRMVGGDLESILRRRRAAHAAWDAIARELYADHGVEVAGVTLKRWGAELNIADPEDVDAPQDAA